jgi:hypothetical protein
LICYLCLLSYSLSLFSALFVVMIMCHGEVLFWSGLFGVLKASCTLMGKTFLRFGEFLFIILLNIFQIPFAWTSAPSSIPIVLMFIPLKRSVSSYIFLSQLLSCLTNISSVFFFNFYFIFKFLDSVFHLFYFAGVDFHCVLHFCLIRFSDVFHILGHLHFNIFCFHL